MSPSWRPQSYFSSDLSFMADMGMACHVPRATRGRDHTEKDADRGARAGNAAQYQASAFNFVPTWINLS
jgi:hypothetical protein